MPSGRWREAWSVMGGSMLGERCRQVLCAWSTSTSGSGSFPEGTRWDEGSPRMSQQRATSRRMQRVIVVVARSTRRWPTAAARWARLPWPDRRSTLRAFLVLLLIEATIRQTRIPRLAAALGIEVGSSLGGTSGHDVVGGDRPELAARLHAHKTHVLSEGDALALRCTLRVMRHWPFGTGPCLRESLVLGNMLRQRDPILRFGVARTRGRVRAHAWIEVDGRPVNDPQGFVPLRGSATSA